MADDKNTANTSPFPEGYQPQSRRERREMEEYFARLTDEKAAAENADAEKATPWAASAGATEATEDDTKSTREVVASAEASAASTGATGASESAAAKNTEREETTDKENAADVETTKDFSEMTPKERRKAKRAE